MLLARHLIAYAHLLFFAVAFAGVAAGDARAALQLSFGRPGSRFGSPSARARRVCLIALGGLWASGVALIALRSAGPSPAWSSAMIAKLCVALALSANALFLSPKLHRALARCSEPSELAPGPLILGALSLSICLSGWLYAAFLSVGGSSWAPSAWALAFGYLLFCALAFIALMSAALASKALSARRLAREIPRRQERLDAQGVEAQIDDNFEAMRRLSNNFPIEPR